MPYIRREFEADLRAALRRGKSVLLLGPRQTGKTTLLDRLEAHLYVSLIDPRVRQRYERDPGQLVGELTFLEEYSQARAGFVVCRTPRRQLLAPRVTALPWQELAAIAGD